LHTLERLQANGKLSLQNVDSGLRIVRAKYKYQQFYKSAQFPNTS